MWFILMRFLLILYVIVLFAFLVRMIGLIITKQNNNLQDFSIIILWPFYILTEKGRKLIVDIWKGKIN